MARIQDIRSAFFRKGWTVSEIAKEYRVDRKTVRKYIMQDDWNESKRSGPAEREGILDPYKPTIDGWLTSDRKERRKQRHTAKRVFERLVEEHHYEGSYRTVAAYVGQRRRELGQDTKPALPLVHQAGEAQVDFGEADYVEAGRLVHGSYLCVSFPASNAGFLQLVPGQNLECLFQALLSIFAWIGGVPTKLWFDNASTVVRAILRGGARELTDRFRRFQEHFGFALTFCNPASGHEKGNVENKVGYLRRNLLVPVPEFESLDAFNAELLRRCDRDNRREHYRKQASIAELFEQDRDELLMLPRIAFDPSRYETVRADAYGMVSLENGRHRYSTSPRYAGTLVRVQITAEKVVVFDDSDRPVVTHRRLYGSTKQESMDWLPYLTQLSRRPRALKYTPVYEMMSDPLRRWIDARPACEIGSALALLAELTRRGGFQSACDAVSDSIARGVTDVDSLVALHDRFTRDFALQDASTAGEQRIHAPRVVFRPERYDQMLSGGRS
jgi:transposase